MITEKKSSTSSSDVFQFNNMKSTTKPQFQDLSVNDVVMFGRRDEAALNYFVPKTFYHKKKPLEENGKTVAPTADGPVYTFSKSKRDHYIKAKQFGKDGKEPPHSYMNIRQWAVVKEGAKESGSRGKSLNRKTYIDDVIQYSQKHKYPGPDAYFKENKKAEEKKPSTKEKIPKRPCFLDEYQYIGLNFPAPGAYQPQDKPKKEKPKGLSKSFKYVPGAWKPKRDQGHGPGDYEITRMYTYANEKDKTKKDFARIPTIERIPYGQIHRPHSTKPINEKSEGKVAPGSYFKDLKDLDRSYQRTCKPMRKY